MKYIPVDKLIAKIERRVQYMQTCIENEYRLSGKAEEEIIFEYKHLQNFIASLQKERDTGLETMEEKERIDEGFTKFIQKWQEQPEVDLEKEIDRFLKSEESTTYGNAGSYIIAVKDPRKIARHFYELARQKYEK